jgi:aspartate kinase
MRVVQKYGGTSVGTIEKIKNIAQNLVEQKKQGRELVIVVSAMGKTTNTLLAKAGSITSNPNKRELDRLLSVGEQETIALLTMALNEFGAEAISLTGYQAGIETTGIHTKSKIKSIDSGKLENYLAEGKIVIVAGFQGINDAGDITTLGRGGSDTSAVALAASLNCECEIYTDVDGIYGVDPRAYSRAKKIDEISYEEMMEMSSLGAGIMEVRAVELGKKYSVPIYVGRTLSDKRGTRIVEKNLDMEEKLITGLGITDNIILVTLKSLENTPENISKIFEALGDAGVNIDMISQTLVENGGLNLSFSCPDDEMNLLNEALDSIRKELGAVKIEEHIHFTKISLVGIGMMSHPGVAGKVFKVFAREGISFYQVTTSEISISYAIDPKDRERAVQALAEEFNL